MNLAHALILTLGIVTTFGGLADAANKNWVWAAVNVTAGAVLILTSVEVLP